MTIEHLNLAYLKAKTPAELLAMAEEWEIENAPSMRKGEMMFQILKEHAEEGWEIGGDGVLEVLQDGSVFCVARRRTIFPVRMTFMSARISCVSSACVRATRLKV